MSLSLIASLLAAQNSHAVDLVPVAIGAALGSNHAHRSHSESKSDEMLRIMDNTKTLLEKQMAVAAAEGTVSELAAELKFFESRLQEQFNSSPKNRALQQRLMAAGIPIVNVAMALWLTRKQSPKPKDLIILGPLILSAAELSLLAAYGDGFTEKAQETARSNRLIETISKIQVLREEIDKLEQVEKRAEAAIGEIFDDNTKQMVDNH